MYFMGMFEFRQYMNAADRLQELTEEHDFIIRNAYADVHPTRIHYDFEQGKMYSESLNVADYAIWLLEMKESHFKQREYWQKRSLAFEDAMHSLSDHEKMLFEEVRANNQAAGRLHRAAIEKLKRELERVVSSRSDLNSKPEPVDFDDTVGVKEWDAKVDKMTGAELFEGYQDVVGEVVL